MQPINPPQQAPGLDGIFNYLNVANERPMQTWQRILTGIAGLLLALGVLQLTLSDQRAIVLLVSVLIIAAGYGAHFIVPEKYTPAAVGVIMAGSGFFLLALENRWLIVLVGLMLSFGFYAAPFTKGHPIFLTAGLFTIWGFFFNLIPDSTSLTTPSVLMLLLAASLLAGGWFLDSKNQNRMALSFYIVGLTSMIIGLFLSTALGAFTGLSGSGLGSPSVDDATATAVSILTILVAAFAIYVGSQTKRRATSWWGAFAIVASFLIMFGVIQNGVGFSNRWFGLVLVLIVAPALIIGANLDDFKKFANSAGQNPQSPFNQGNQGQANFPGQQQPQQFQAPTQAQNQPAVPQDPTQLQQPPAQQQPAPQQGDQNWFGADSAQQPTEAQTPIQQPVEQTPAAAQPQQQPAQPEPGSVPNWYPDPTGRFEYRWHDGNGWTQHVSVSGNASVDPEPI